MKLQLIKFCRNLAVVLSWTGTVLLAVALLALIGLCVSSYCNNIEMVGTFVFTFTASLTVAVLSVVAADLLNPN